MDISNINGSTMKSEIYAAFNADGIKNDYDGRVKLLDQIAGWGKEIINKLNEDDKTVYEIEADYETCASAIEEAQKELDVQIENADKASTIVSDADDRIAELEGKIENGEELTEDEAAELEVLYRTRGDAQKDSENANGKINSLSGNVSNLTGKLAGYNNTLNEIVSQMDGKAEAGDVIKDAATTYGRDMNCEKTMERNETSWWNFTNKKGGVHEEIGVIAGLSLGGILSTTIGGIIGKEVGKNSKTQMEVYTERAGLTEVADQTFYSKDAGFVAEYDAIEKKGGNQVGGKMRKATVKAFSYGKTIHSASDIVKKKAETIDIKDPSASED